MGEYILTLDQGTTSSRAILFDRNGGIQCQKQYEFPQYYPQNGWVEQNPMEILSSQMLAMEEAMEGVSPEAVAAIAITNQRETTVVWDAATGEPVYPAIVWQCRRTAGICDKYKAKGLAGYIQETTGLVLDAYFSATKIKWILDNVPRAREKAEAGALRFGTVDTWLLWNLTKGAVHATDYSNASRTMLFDINRLCWDEKLLAEFGIPAAMMPQVKDTSGVFGYTKIKGRSIPIASMAGDQQAALFGQNCFRPGQAKNTYGTGCFILMNTGEKRIRSRAGLLTTIAWGLGGQVTYALEGSVFNAGAAVQWLRDGLQIIDSAAQSQQEAQQVPDSGGVVFVPAFTGLGAPYWDMYARGTVLGLSRGTTRQHIIRAVLESIAYQSGDVMAAMEADSGISLTELYADGGASANDVLMQFQADILGIAVKRPQNIESTAMGAAFLAGLATGFWKDQSQVAAIRALDRTYQPQMPPQEREKRYSIWHKAVQRAMDWAEKE